MPVLQVIFLLRTGIVLYSKKLSHDLPSEEMVSPFISAIITFARQSFKREDLSNIQIGDNLLTIETGFLNDPESENETLDLLSIMLSTGIDDSTAHAILEELTEEFTIALEEQVNNKNISIDHLKKGKSPALKSFDEIISDVINREHDKVLVKYNLSVSIPKETIDLIMELFKKNDDIGDLYQYKESSMIEQLLIEYIYYDLESRIRKKFGIKEDRNDS